VLITGDDILIEYVERLMNALKQVPVNKVTEEHYQSIEKFITHYVWHCKDRKDNTGSLTLWQRLEGRLNEMLERRRRLIKYLFKKEKRLDEFEEKFAQNIAKKTQIIRKFSPSQLEDLLRTSTKNVAQEVVSSLIPQKGQGVLSDLDR